MPTLRILFFIASTCFLALEFSINLFNSHDATASPIAHSTDTLVVGRFHESIQNGYFSYGGLLGYRSNIELKDTKEVPRTKGLPIKLQEEQIQGMQTKPGAYYIPYKSHHGGNAFFYSFFVEILGGLNAETLMTLKLIAAICTSIILSIFGLIILSEFGLFPATVTIIGCGLTISLASLGGSIFWSLFSIYTVFVYLFYNAIADNDYFARTSKIFWTVFWLGVLKFAFNGYEFITSFLLMTYIPIVYAFLRNTWTVSQFKRVSVTVTYSQLLACLVSVSILIIQITIASGSVNDGLDHILDRLAYRTVGIGEVDIVRDTNQTKNEISAVIVTSLKQSAIHLEHILGHASSTATPVRGRLLVFGYYELLLTFLVAASLLLILRTLPTIDISLKIKLRAISWAFVISFIAPISWFIVFKSHAYIHRQLDLFVYSMPTMILGYAVFGICLRELARLIAKLSCQVRAEKNIRG